MQKSGEILKTIVTTILWLLIVGAIAFATYVYALPDPVQIVAKDYTAIDTSYYNVDENELDGEWIEIENYTVDKNDLDRYEDLKELYKGRDNPFGTLDGLREEIIYPQEPRPPEEIEIE